MAANTLAGLLVLKLKNMLVVRYKCEYQMSSYQCVALNNVSYIVGQQYITVRKILGFTTPEMINVLPIVKNLTCEYLKHTLGKLQCTLKFDLI